MSSCGLEVYHRYNGDSARRIVDERNKYFVLRLVFSWNASDEYASHEVKVFITLENQQCRTNELGDEAAYMGGAKLLLFSIQLAQFNFTRVTSNHSRDF